ncbi:8-amino-7-oxononanoate synthase [Novosphingobium sp. SL115]|uniref:8-amino-7-oxononanoate synthase n=1 Tax=Novosphingobium sp. SL115 TaxID=2995150 RepID=UPI002275D7D8|nr:8-amino-7-oxononanoate synthase [Novosphingobium sp. SL115]MCY1670951.1 8-amino-7-oxononanoate synthase [Novosphingobium sp. SL115]
MAQASTRTTSLWSAHTADLAALGEKARLRSLVARRGVDFASNDYLAMSSSPRLAGAVQNAIARGVPLGSGGSRLLRGNDPEHELLEEEAARFFGSEAALFFSTGYAANAALLSTLPQRGDLIVYDELVHASMHEGLRLTRATSVSAAHNDAQSFDDAVHEWRQAGNTGRVWLAFETLYSMDGDMAPVADLAAIAARHDAVMFIDEAHATGVFGPDGRGLAAHLEGRPDTIVLRTCGKAMGCEGALVLAPRVVRDFLVNRGRAFIFSTAPSPLVCAAVREAIRMLADEPQRRGELRDLVAHAERVLAPHGATVTGSQILPLILHEDARTMAVAATLQSQGFDVRGIRPPTVPQGTSRLRISLTLNATTQDVDALAEVLQGTLR